MPTNITIHRVNGEASTMCSLDARRALRDHPEEWRSEPWPTEAQKKARKDPSIVPYAVPESVAYSHGQPATIIATD